MPETIEAEVIEIDGVPPPEPPPRPDSGGKAPDWSAWKSRALTLDRRWWPLWVLLGILLVGVLLVFGLIAGVVLVALRLFRGFVSFLTGGRPSGGGTSIRPHSS